MYRLLRFDILSNVFCCCNLAIHFYCQAISVVLGGVCMFPGVARTSLVEKHLHQGQRAKDDLQLRWIHPLAVLMVQLHKHCTSVKVMQEGRRSWQKREQLLHLMGVLL